MMLEESITSVMSKYGTFRGRASRSEFWWFYLFATILGWAASVVGELTMGQYGGILNVIVALALAVPYLAVGCRRLHDIGRSGWWQLLYLTLFGVILLVVWYCSKGTSGENRFGSDPRTYESMEPATIVDVAAANPAALTQAAASPQAFEDRYAALERLVKLKESGVLTEQEFAVEKKKILGNP